MAFARPQEPGIHQRLAVLYLNLGGDEDDVFDFSTISPLTEVKHLLLTLLVFTSWN